MLVQSVIGRDVETSRAGLRVGKSFANMLRKHWDSDIVSDRAETKQHIRNAALELFMTQGYERTSVREIAARVGMSPSNLYSHFASKELLLKAVLEDAYAAYNPPMTAILQQDAPFLERLDALVAWVCRLQDSSRFQFLLLYGRPQYAAELYNGHGLVEALISAIRDAIARKEILPVNSTLATGMMVGGLRENAQLVHAGMRENLHLNYAELVEACHRLLPALQGPGDVAA